MIGWLGARLHRKLSALFGALILLPIAVIVGYSLDRTSEITIGTARQERLRGAGVRASTVVRSLTDIGDDLQFVGQTPIVRSYLNARTDAERAAAVRDVERLFVAFLTRSADKYSRMCMLDTTGREIDCAQVIGGAPHVVPAQKLVDRSKQPFFAAATAPRVTADHSPIYISDVELSAVPDRGAPVATLRYAIALQNDAGALDAVLVLDALVAPILRTLEPPADGGATYVVDRDGNYLLHPDPHRRFAHLRGAARSLSNERPRDAMLILSHPGGTLYSSPDAPGMLQVFARIQPPGQYNVVWTLIDDQSLDTMLAEVGRTRAVILSVAGVALLLAIIAAVLITRGIVGPLGALARATRSIDESDPDVALPLSSRPDEVGLLTQSFAQMAARVRSLLGALRQRVAELERSDAALRAGEARLRQMVDTNLAGIIFVDVRTGEVLEANDAFLRIVGYDREDLRAGRIERDKINPPEYRERTRRAIAQARERGACTPYEKEYVRKDGTRVPVLIGLAMAEGSLYEAVAFVLDQTATKQAEAEQKARLDAESANRTKSEFLARMSHELRTPLNAILGFAHIMRWDAGLSERSRAGLAAIQTSGEHLLQLIVDLLDLSRIEAGRFKLDPKPTEVERVLSDVRDIISVRAQQKSLEFITEVASSVPHTVVCDDLRLRQVLLNLLGNAVKFTDRGEVRLRMSARASSPGTVLLRAEIVDTGIGLAPHELQRLFRPFEQVGDEQRRAAGTGLGLAISQQIVQEMGGMIRVESREGRGSRFWFELPVPVIDRDVDEHRSAQPRPAFDGARRKVLVVDNDQLNRAMLIDLLRELGFELYEAENGQQALDVTRLEHPDLILMDIEMPVMDGLETMRRLRRMPGFERVPVICVSASAGSGGGQSASAAGADAFITKPVDIDRLLELIDKLLGSKAATAGGDAKLRSVRRAAG
jgi:PAS domain S-box-containing protein